MSVECGWMILCRQAIVDQENNVTLVGCIEQVQAKVFPVTLGDWSLVAMLYRPPSEAVVHEQVPLRLIVEPPGRERVVLADFSSEFRPSLRRSRLLLRLSGLQLASPGSYSFLLETDGDRVLARLPLDVGSTSAETVGG